MSDPKRNGSRENPGGTASTTLVQQFELSNLVRAPNRHIAPHSQVEEPGTREAIQRYVKDGLTKVQRRSKDPNRVDIIVPEDFLHTPLEATDRERTFPSPAEPVERSKNASDVSDATKHLGTNIHLLETFGGESIVGTPMSVLGEGRVDPFTRYPIEMGDGERWLIDQVYTNENLIFKNLKERWLPLVIKDPGAFHQFLSNVALNFFLLIGGPQNCLISVAHHSLAVRTVNWQLSDPVLRTGNDVIASIVEFVCYSVSREDITSCCIHLDGLANIVRIRGGIWSLGDSMLSKLIYGVDISAACRFDMKPRFPLPEEVPRGHFKQVPQEQEPHAKSTQKALPWLKLLPAGNPLIEIFGQIHTAILYTKSKELRKAKWKCIEYILYWIDPIMHNLLSLETETDGKPSENLLFNMCRLGICIFLGPIRRNCGKLGVSTKIYVRKLKTLLSNPHNANVIKVPRAFMLWLLFFGMLESRGLQDEQWYLASLAKTASGFGLVWDDLVAIVSGFLWMDSVYQKELEDAKSRFTLKEVALWFPVGRQILI